MAVSDLAVYHRLLRFGLNGMCCPANLETLTLRVILAENVPIFASGPTGTDACIDLESRLVTAVWMNDTR